MTVDFDQYISVGGIVELGFNTAGTSDQGTNGDILKNYRESAGDMICLGRLKGQSTVVFDRGGVVQRQNSVIRAEQRNVTPVPAAKGPWMHPQPKSSR